MADILFVIQKRDGFGWHRYPANSHTHTDARSEPRFHMPKILGIRSAIWRVNYSGGLICVFVFFFCGACVRERLVENNTLCGLRGEFAGICYG